MKTITIILAILAIVLLIVDGLLMFKPKTTELPEETAIQLAKQTTIIRPSFATTQEIDKLLKGTRMTGLGWALKVAEEETGVPADFMWALALQESHLGNNNKWSLPPYNNPYSWDITEKGPGPEAKFNSISDCILFVAQKLKKYYLTPGAVYYKGETPQSVAVYYCGGDDIAWYTGILNGMKTFQASLTESKRAKIWIMESRVLCGDAPAPQFFVNEEEYWKDKISWVIALYRINGGRI